jgi:signal peptidase II
MTPTLKRIALLAVTLLLIDQISKQWIVNHLVELDGFTVTSFFNIARVHNPGAAFGFLANAGGLQRYFFTVLSFVVSAYLLWLMWKSPNDRRQCLALGLIVSGAIGNVIDRIRFGYVVDFLDVHAAGLG